MSITSALSNALSGLGVASRAADVASSNLANVLTEGYAPRSLEVNARSGVSGASVTGIQRQADDGLIGDRRLATSDAAYAETRADFVADVQRAVGMPDDENSLSGRVAAFEASLVSAASRPDETARLQQAVHAAERVADGFNAASGRIQDLRTRADTRIGQTVDAINEGLRQIHALNERIVAAKARGATTAGYQDQRQAALDRLAAEIPIRQVPRGNGSVAIFTTGGASLLDGRPANVDFQTSNLVTPHMTRSNGGLSGLTINGVAVDPSGDRGPLAGGRLSGLFEVRDNLAVSAQAHIDSLARDVAQRFQDPALDSTRPPGAAGLFTDDGILFDPAAETGFAARISVNELVDAGQGGEAWRLRDGLGAAPGGPVGDANLLQQMQAMLAQPLALSSGDLSASRGSFSSHVSALSSRLGQDRLAADQSLSFARANEAELKTMEMENGVDTDAEMQNLLMIEQLYAANAKMMQTIDDMMQTLLRI